MDLNIIHQTINQTATNKSTISTRLTVLFSKTPCTDCIDIVLATDMKLNPKINYQFLRLQKDMVYIHKLQILLKN